MPNRATTPVIGIVTGDLAGIGPEVIKKALRHPKLPKGFRYEIIGAGPGIKPGKSTPRSAQLAWNALERSFIRWQKGELAAIVTGPVHKETMASVGFPYPGQTEFFAAKCGKDSNHPVMLFNDQQLRVALCSTHCSLSEAIKLLTVKKVQHVARQSALFLHKLGILKPRIALAGLNPHAGENGLFGNEEKKILKPAIRQLQREGLHIEGPISADTVFYRAIQGEYDLVISTYHDQGLIPFKLLAFNTGVNVTLGLPLIRTSPDHGTALDIAGKNKADPRSMLAAIQLACQLASEPKGWPALKPVSKSKKRRRS